MERRQIIQLSIFALLVVFWFSGLAGLSLVVLCDGLLLPWEISKEVDLTSIAYGDATGELSPGADLRISSDRTKYILKEVAGWKSIFVPPHFVRHGLVFVALNEIEMSDDTVEYFPVRIVVDDGMESPLFRVRIKVDFLNRLLTGSDLLGKRKSRKEWVLGHYELKNMKTFDSFSLQSKPVAAGTDITKRQLKAEATGWVRYKFDENLFSARSTARVKKMTIEADLGIRRRQLGVHRNKDGGFCIKYEVRITELKGDFNNIAPVLDAQLCETLRKSIERSLNKEKKKNKLARILFPPWTPIDMNLDVRLVP